MNANDEVIALKKTLEIRRQTIVGLLELTDKYSQAIQGHNDICENHNEPSWMIDISKLDEWGEDAVNYEGEYR